LYASSVPIPPAMPWPAGDDLAPLRSTTSTGAASRRLRSARNPCSGVQSRKSDVVAGKTAPVPEARLRLTADPTRATSPGRRA